MKTIIKTKFVKNLFLATFAIATTGVIAQEEEVKEKEVKISGSVDAYYRTNLTSTDRAIIPDGSGGFIPQAPGTSFANETGFALGFANLIATYEGEKVGAVADLVFGPRGEQAITGLNLNQLYAYWKVSKSTTLTLGRFNTYLGYEVIAPASNFNYSTSYLFSNGPFSHTGFKADFALDDDWSLMLAVMNVTDIDNNLTGEYAIGAQLGFFNQYLNFYFDDEANLGFEVDYTGGFNLTEDLFLGINGAVATNDGAGFGGVALYPQLKTLEDFTIGLRGEYFTAFDGEDATEDPNVIALTLTGSYSVENLTIKPEIRLDSFGNDFEPFLDNDLAPSSSLASFLVAAIYSF